MSCYENFVPGRSVGYKSDVDKLRRVFTSDSDMIIVASKTRVIPPPSADVFSIPELKKQLDRFGVSTRDDLLLRKLGDRKSLSPLFASYAVSRQRLPAYDIHAVGHRRGKERRIGRTLAPVHRQG